MSRFLPATSKMSNLVPILNLGLPTLREAIARGEVSMRNISVGFGEVRESFFLLIQFVSMSTVSSFRTKTTPCFSSSSSSSPPFPRSSSSNNNNNNNNSKRSRRMS